MPLFSHRGLGDARAANGFARSRTNASKISHHKSGKRLKWW